LTPTLLAELIENVEIQIIASFGASLPPLAISTSSSTSSLSSLSISQPHSILNVGLPLPAVTSLRTSRTIGSAGIPDHRKRSSSALSAGLVTTPNPNVVGTPTTATTVSGPSFLSRAVSLRGNPLSNSNSMDRLDRSTSMSGVPLLTTTTRKSSLNPIVPLDSSLSTAQINAAAVANPADDIVFWYTYDLRVEGRQPLLSNDGFVLFPLTVPVGKHNRIQSNFYY